MCWVRFCLSAFIAAVAVVETADAQSVWSISTIGTSAKTISGTITFGCVGTTFAAIAYSIDQLDPQGDPFFHFEIPGDSDGGIFGSWDGDTLSAISGDVLDLGSLQTLIFWFDGSFEIGHVIDGVADGQYQIDPIPPRLTFSDTTNIALAASQVECGPDMSDNPDVTGGAGGILIPYTATGSFTCCGPTYLADNLDDGDVGAGVGSDGTYAIPDSGTLVLDFGSPETLTSMAVYSGYANRDDGTYTLRDDADNVLGAWDITTLTGSSNNDTVSYGLRLDEPVRTGSLTLEMSSADLVDTSSFREIQVLARPRIIDDTRIILAATQIESGPDTSENPYVTGAAGPLIPYAATGSFTCCGPTHLADNLDDGDVGAGVGSDGTYAIPDSGTLVLDFGSTRTLGSIAIYNGYTNRDDGTYTLRDDANNVLGAWTITTISNDTNDGVDSFWLTFDTPVTTSSLTLELASVDEDGTVSFREIQIMGPNPSVVPAIGPLGRGLVVASLLAASVSVMQARRRQHC
jgi:hypothetical protein